MANKVVKVEFFVCGDHLADNVLPRFYTLRNTVTPRFILDRMGLKNGHFYYAHYPFNKIENGVSCASSMRKGRRRRVPSNHTLAWLFPNQRAIRLIYTEKGAGNLGIRAGTLPESRVGSALDVPEDAEVVYTTDKPAAEPMVTASGNLNPVGGEAASAAGGRHKKSTRSKSKKPKSRSSKSKSTKPKSKKPKSTKPKLTKLKSTKPKSTKLKPRSKKPKSKSKKPKSKKSTR